MSYSLIGIFYDLDGTLVDSHRCIRETYRELCYAAGIRPRLSSRILSRIGHDWKKFLRRKNLEPEKAEEIYRMKIEKIKVFPEVKRILKYNKKNEKVQGIVTHSPRDVVEEILKKNKIKKLIDGMVTWDDIEEKGLRPKPEPDTLLYLARDLNLETKSCLYIGNSKEDIVAGKKAGMLTLGVSYDVDYKNIINLVTARPHLGVITSPHQLYIYFTRLIL
ncbi:MAG: HAD family hydrolase [Candidatus Aenigmatarchaeota archaeon]